MAIDGFDRVLVIRAPTFKRVSLSELVRDGFRIHPGSGQLPVFRPDMDRVEPFGWGGVTPKHRPKPRSGQDGHGPLQTKFDFTALLAHYWLNNRPGEESESDHA